MIEKPRHSRLVDRSPIHYSWVILAVGTLGVMMTTPGQTIGVSVFLDSIIEDLQSSRTHVALLYTLGTLAASLALPWVGRAIDRRGPRALIGPIAFGLTLATWVVALSQNLWVLALGFLMLRGFGQGALSLISQHIINLWFVRRRGLAVGVTGVGFAAAGALFPLISEQLIGSLGWRSAYALLGVAVALTILPLGMLLFRDRPERYGQRPDGGPKPTSEAAPGSASSSASVTTAATEPNISAEEARRSPSFWVVALSIATISSLTTALIFHHYDLMASRGLERATATAAFAYLAWMSALVNLTTGALSDRLGVRIPVVLMLLLQAGTLLMATLVTSATLPLYAALIGATMGMSGNLAGSAYAYLFGRRALGAIRGLATTLSVAGAASGPVIFSLASSSFGGYTPLLLALTPLTIALAVASLVALRRP